MSDYEHDFYAWTQEQAEALRAKEWKTLDVETPWRRRSRAWDAAKALGHRESPAESADAPAEVTRRPGCRATARLAAHDPNARREIAKRARPPRGLSSQYLKRLTIVMPART